MILLFVINLSLHGVDTVQTVQCHCRELNPILSSLSSTKFVVTKLGIASGTNYLIFRLKRNHSKIALVLMAASIGVETYAVVHNRKLK